MKGKFVTLEGSEGVGKSTQVRLLKQYCEDNGIKAVFTREPGGTDISEQIRSIILDPKNTAMDDITELLLYVAARRQHTQQFIRAKLEEGYIVFCDRYIDSTMAYQGYARGLDQESIRQLNELAMGDVHIDATIFLDLPPEQGFARKGGNDTSDRLENEKLEFFTKVYRGYCEIARKDSRVAAVDASGNVEQVFDGILHALRLKNIIEG